MPKFTKGQSGNPGGRPKGSVSLATELRGRITKQTAAAIVEKLIADALAGERDAMRLVWLYTEGRPAENRGEPQELRVQNVSSDDVIGAILEARKLLAERGDG